MLLLRYTKAKQEFNMPPEQPQPQPPISPVLTQQPSRPPQPVGTQPGVPPVAAVLGIPQAAAKSTRNGAVTSIILGVLMLMIGLIAGVLIDVTYLGNIIFGVLYIVFGVKVKKPTTTVAQFIFYTRVISVTVVLNLIVGILSGNGAGILPIIILLFFGKAYRLLFEAGLITSKAPLTAKPRV